MARVEVYTRQGCHLCDEAIAVVARVCAELGEDYVLHDIDSDPAWLAAYNDEVPVTLVDGQRHDLWRVDAARLRAALTR